MKSASLRRRRRGSPTNANDAVDDLGLPPHPTLDERLDEGVQETFPASDSVAVDATDETEWEKRKRDRR